MARALLVILAVLGADAGALSGGSDLVVSGQTKEATLEAAWTKELDSDDKEVKQKSPIQRVVVLLKQMKVELESEADKENEMYDQQVCWCETNDKEKTKAISDADAKDLDLSAEIETRAARHGVLSTEIAALKKQIAADEEALKKATVLREEEAGAFRGSENEMVQAITNLKNAIAVLSRHHGGALVQLDAPQLASVHAVLRDVALKYSLMRADRLGRTDTVAHTAPALLAVDASGLDHELLGALAREDGSPNVGSSDRLPVQFAQDVLEKTAQEAQRPASSGAFMQADGRQPYYKSYAPQSGVIFGILKQMKEEFEQNLSQEQKDEIQAAEAYKELAKAKAEQIAKGKERLDAMEAEHAGNQKALSDAKEDLDLTRSQRSADIEFLRNLKLTCQGLDKAWADRSKTRGEEITAVSEALAIITEDDARDLMAKTVSLLQEQSVSDAQARARRIKAAAALRKAAYAPDFATDDLLTAWHSRRTLPAVGGVGGPRAQLATLAVTVELDGFTKVTEIIEKMIADLQQQQKAEVEQKAYCTKEFNTNEKTILTKNGEKEDLQGKMDELAQLIETLQGDIESATAQIAESKVQIKKASENREKENAEFQTTVSDQRATQAVLAKALTRLAVFYKKALLQKSAEDPTPPVQFNAYKKNSGSSSVMGLLEQIVEDSKKVEAEATAGENQAQATYETFVKNSNSVIEELSQSITDKTKAIAGAMVDASQAKSDHESTVGELDALDAYKADLHQQCDFLLTNFEIRQKARLQEIEAIQSAKAFLSGMQTQ